MHCLTFFGGGIMGEISLKLNGKLETKDVADNTLLIDFIIIT